MIGIIADISGPLSLMIAFLGVVWMLRCEKCVFFKEGIMPMIVLCYAIWNFLVHNNLPHDLHLIIHNLFLIAVAATIAIQCNPKKLSFRMNRRKEAKPYERKNRRKGKKND